MRGDVLLVDNKSLDLIKINWKYRRPQKLDEFISLYLYQEIYRLRKQLKRLDAKWMIQNKELI